MAITRLNEVELFNGINAIVDFWPDPVVVIDKECSIVAASADAKRILCWFEPMLPRPIAHDTLCVQARDHAHDVESCPFFDPDSYRDWTSSFWCNADGDYLSVDVRATSLTGDLTGLTAWSFIDNRERAHNHAEFEKFAQFVELSPAPIGEFDSDGQLLFANQALQVLLMDAGYDSEGNCLAFPKNLIEICVTAGSNRSLNPSNSANDRPYIVSIGDQFFKWHFMKLDTQSSAQVPGEVIGFAFDVTQAHQHQLQLEETKKAARRDFYAKMIHELRTPLNAIMGFSDLLLKRSATQFTERERKNLVAINNAGFQLNELVSDTLDISKIEAGFMALEISEFSINELCDSFMAQIESLATAKRLEFKWEISSEIYLMSDRQKIRQILINLLSNAIKYTQSGRVSLVGEIFKNQFVLSVIDTGIGIPEAQIHKLFGHYSQIDEAKNAGIAGTGLGLALVAELVKMLGGTIQVKSEYEKGSCFTVSLPLTTP